MCRFSLGHYRCALVLPSAERVLALQPDWPALAPYFVGVVGASPKGSDTAVEVRAFMGGEGAEDPVTGSLNASLAQWMIGAGLVASPYVASQGTAMQRAGRVYLHQDGEGIWVGEIGRASCRERGEVWVGGVGV